MWAAIAVALPCAAPAARVTAGIAKDWAKAVTTRLIPLALIEVQVGSYLGEDDIVRIEDTYGRS